MVDITGRIQAIIAGYIRKNKYFVINRARQYGKTTLLYGLEERLKAEYLVLSLSFEAADEYFQSSYALAEGLVMDIADCLRSQNVPEEIINSWSAPVSERFPMRELGKRITRLCQSCDRRSVLIIDEVDKSSDNQVFLSFLGLLRAKYLEQQKKRDMTFQSVILAGVYDIKNLKLKLHPDQEPKYNSPWNIAADFRIDMSFSEEETASMLAEYESDHGTGMDIALISRLIYAYTSGYPYLVSRICQLTDECIAGTEIFPDKKSAWTREGISAAEMLLRRESNTLFDDMAKKFADYPDLKSLLKDILFKGSSFPFDPDNHLIRLGITFGFLKEKNGNVAIQNRIFETKMYDLFLSEDSVDSIIYHIIVDYLGQQYIIELKIWHGEEYNKKGERQLAEYLEYYNKDTGYLLSFSFHQKKQVGVRETLFAGKRIIEAIV